MTRLVLTVLSLGALGMVALVSLTACGDDSTSPSDSLCSRLDVGRTSFDIEFAGACSSFESTLTNMEYNSFGELVAFEFDVRCTTSSERYTGRVWDIVLEDHRDVISYQATINGENCSYP